MLNRQPSFLHLITGDLSQVVHIGRVSIQVGPQQRPPFPVSAIVVEQDTAMVLDDESILQTPVESLRQLRDEVERFREPELGSVVIQRGKPRRFYAIVHDLEQEPTWREEWIQTALETLFREIERLRLNDLAMPLLGTRFGNLSTQRFIELLCTTLQDFPLRKPLKLWMIAPRHRTHSLLIMLRRCASSSEMHS